MQRGKYLLVFIFLCVTYEKALCQLAVFQDEDAIITPGFIGDIIHTKKISQVILHYFTKPDGGGIVNNHTEQQYFFDTAGKMTESAYTVQAGNGETDTMKCRYYYDSARNITIKRADIDGVFDTHYYKWYNNHRVEKETHVHEINVLNPDGTYKLTTQMVISTDSFSYISYPKELQQYEYNEDNKFFKKIITGYDDKNRLISRNCQYVVGSLFSQVNIKYDTLGKITRYINTGNINGEINQNIAIQYSVTGKIDEENITEKDKPKHKIEFMYDNDTGLISNKLDRDFDKAQIDIVRFSYEMYGTKKGLSAANK